MEIISKKLVLVLVVMFVQLSVYSSFQIVNDPNKVQQMGGDYIDDVIIYPGNMVEVVSQVNMGEGKRIIVSKGAILKVNGQVITSMYKKCSNCDYKGETKLWFGIVVMGVNLKSQDVEHKMYCDNKIISCFDYKLDAVGNRVYTVNNPKACLGNFDQGIVYLKNSRIEYSSVGIVAGTVSVFGTVARANGGALLILEDSEFKNNRFGSIMFADYLKFVQMSHVMNNKVYLTTDFITQYKISSGRECRYIAMSLNNFKFNISGNILTSEMKDGNYPITGVYLVQSNVKLRSNLNISNLNKGISVSAYVPGFNMGSSTINYNVLSSNNIGIHLQGVDKMNVNYNTLNINGNNLIASKVIQIAEKDHQTYVQGWDLLSNNALGTYADGAFNLSYNKNSHQLGSSTSLNRTWGIFFNNANNTSGYIKNNSFSGMYNASFFNSGNNNYVNVLCNKYNSTFSDLVVENIKNTGIRNVGTSLSPSGNTFQPNVRVNTCVTSESVRNEYYGTIVLKYYYQSTSPSSLPIATYAVARNAVYNTRPKCFEYYSEPIANVPCDGPVIVKPNDRKAQYLQAQVNYNLSKLRLQTGVSDDVQEDHVFYRSVYDQSLTDLLNHYAESSILDSVNKVIYRDSISYLLQNHQTFAGKYYLTQYYLEDKKWSEAKDVLGQLESVNDNDSLILDYCDYMRMMIGFASNDYDASWLKSHFEEIKVIADDASHMMSAKAKVLCQMAVEIDVENALHDSVLFAVELPVFVKVQDSLAQNDSMDMLIYPNPSSQYLNVVLDNFVPKSRTYNWEIVDLSGNVLKTGELIFNMEAVVAVKIDVSLLASDQFYCFKLMDGANFVKSASFKKI